GTCETCQTAIFDDHPYSWCDRCGAPLPEAVKSALPKLQEMARHVSEPGVPLRVKNRDVQCPICEHDRFFTNRKLVPGRAEALFGWIAASATADTYVCVSCGHMLWFMPPR